MQTLLLAYNAIITFYSYHGLGSQLLDVMTTADVRLAVVFENVLFDLASVGLLVAKASLISFLMRLVPQHHSPLRWRLLVIGPLACLAVVSLGAILAYWARCFGELAGTALLCSSIAPAMRWMQAAAALSVAVDLWYAALPWYLLRRLSRPRREKVLIQGSMSLGVIAAGCGIARTLSIEPAANNSDPESGMSLFVCSGEEKKTRGGMKRNISVSQPYKTTTNSTSTTTAAILYLWHGAEMAVTMICIGMPVCRPAVSSMLQALGWLAPLSQSTSARGTHGSSGPRRRGRRFHGPLHYLRGGNNNSNNNNNNGNQNSRGHHNTDKSHPGSGYIRNYSSGTWEDAVGAADVDSWSQRRILGVGGATSGVVGGAAAGPLPPSSSKKSGGSGSGDSFHSLLVGAGANEKGLEEFGAGADDRDLLSSAAMADDGGALGYPMRALSKSGITVTRTVDITNGRKD